MKIQIETNAEFDKLLEDYNRSLLLIKFEADWCGPCKLLQPVIDNIQKENPELKVVKINVDESPEIQRRFGIRSVPTMFIYRNAKLMTKLYGLVNKPNLQLALDKTRTIPCRKCGTELDWNEFNVWDVCHVCDGTDRSGCPY